MFSKVSRFMRSMAVVACFAGAAMFATNAFADKVHLKDGTVLEGKIVREEQGFIYLKMTVGSISSERFILRDDIKKIEKDDAPATEKTDAKAADSKPDAPAAKDGKDGKADEKDRHTGATRVAILNFGPPNEWLGVSQDMVGVQISADAFAKAVPMLKKAKVDVVVIRINSGGGYTLERDRFEDVFENLYKPNFRTVAWVQSAISAAAMSPWVLEEFYFYPDGSIGGCTEWSGGQIASKGARLEMILSKMERASAKAKRDPKIMRAMQIMEPLSVDIDESGNVQWRQDLQGQYIISEANRVLTMNASDACRFGFGKGIAATKEELAKAMKLQEVEWVAQDATKFIDDNIKENDRAEKRAREVFERYGSALGVANQAQDKKIRGAQLAKAKQALSEIRRFVQLNENLRFHLGPELSEEWFEEQNEIIKEIASRP